MHADNGGGGTHIPGCFSRTGAAASSQKAGFLEGGPLEVVLAIVARSLGRELNRRFATVLGHYGARSTLIARQSHTSGVVAW
jgi:hypothetical protein